MHLDDEARARLRALADATRGELDETARARIAQHVASTGPRAMRRARLQRTGLQIAALIVVFGAAGYRLLAPAAPVAQREAARPQPAPPTAPAAVAVARTCEQRSVPEPQRTFAGGRMHVDLGNTGTVAVDDGAQMWLDTSEPCRLRVRLLSGRVRVHAADLGGGEMRVVTPSGDVVVHGTTFGVAHDASGLTVEVDEGRVGVQSRSSAAPHLVGAGQRLHEDAAHDVRVEPLPESEREALRAALSEVAVAVAPRERPAREPHAVRAAAPETLPAPAASAAALVAEADALWLRGEHDLARDRYRRAGALADPTAEAAWLALARRELSIGAPAAARGALEQYRARFTHGKLATEADGIAFRAALQQGDVAEARTIARRLIARAPGTPQTEAAKRWLESHE